MLQAVRSDITAWQLFSCRSRIDSFLLRLLAFKAEPLLAQYLVQHHVLLPPVFVDLYL